MTLSVWKHCPSHRHGPTSSFVRSSTLSFLTVGQEPVVRWCLSCLREAAIGQMDNLYTTALLSYTFTLAGDEQMRSRLLRHLDQRCNTQGRTVEKTSSKRKRGVPNICVEWWTPQFSLVELALASCCVYHPFTIWKNKIKRRNLR